MPSSSTPAPSGAFDPQDGYPLELAPPDIAAHRQGNTGIDWLWSFESGRPGPHVLLSAVVHGNELCGAIAIDAFLREGLRPRRGRLSLGFMNVEAFQRFDPADPSASRFVDEDFNRVWSLEALDGPRDSVELRRARTLRPFIDEVDLLLDIHSMQHRTPPLMMAGPLAKGRAFAGQVGIPALVVSDQGHAAGRRLRDYGGFGDPESPRNALLIECGQHWEAAAAPLAVETALRFLVACGTLEAGDVAGRLGGPPPAQRFIEVTQAVTIESDDFAFVEDFRGMETIPRQGSLLAHDGGRPVVTPYDDCVLIMPSRRLKRGQTAVRLGRYLG